MRAEIPKTDSGTIQEEGKDKPETGNSAHDKHVAEAKASVPLPKSRFGCHLKQQGVLLKKEERKQRHLVVMHKAVPEKRFVLNERNFCL